MGNKLQVILAGHNGDVSASAEKGGVFSPETLSAAYARISRSPAPVPELREEARMEIKAARRSNQTIVFGLGHHSVAEHAVFNFDILGLSRLAIEALEWHRLCSYTERSQRYITLDGDWVMPQEFDAEERKIMTDTVEAQNAYYHDVLPKLIAAQCEKHPDLAKSKKTRGTVEGWAKEDARYVCSLATEGQLGFTANARNLELIIRRFRQSPLAEIRDLGQQLFDAARAIAPSLVILADEEEFEKAHGITVQDDYFKFAHVDLVMAAEEVVVPEATASSAYVRGDVILVEHTPGPDVSIVSSMLFAAGCGDAINCSWAASGMSVNARLQFIARALRHLSAYDSVPRAFEEATFKFEIVLDASALAQLKRHRMSTQIWGEYDPSLGVTVPPMIEEIGEKDSFLEIMGRTDLAWCTIRNHAHCTSQDRDDGDPVAAADYVLTNAHRRRVTVTMNMREMYHFSRMREDRHAQWAIRKIATDMCHLVREVAPATACLLAGKDKFDEVARSVRFDQEVGRERF